MDYPKAIKIAREVVAYLAEFCETDEQGKPRIIIAGSLRREKPEVKDIEIVCVPRLVHAKTGSMFDGVDFPDEPAPRVSAITRDALIPITGQGGLRKHGDRYSQFLLPEGIYVDLFCVLPPAQWGVILAIRTGSAEFSHWLVTSRRRGGAMPSNLHVADGALRNTDNSIIPTPTEEAFFAAIGLPWMEPNKREGWQHFAPAP